VVINAENRILTGSDVKLQRTRRNKTKCIKQITILNFKWSIRVVFSVTSKKQNKSNTTRIFLFIVWCSFYLATTCFGLYSIRPSSGREFFIEENVQYIKSL
jgi:hypothetical protein